MVDKSASDYTANSLGAWCGRELPLRISYRQGTEEFDMRGFFES